MSPSPPPAVRRVRSAVEGLVCLCLGVILFREVAAEGYMITTGSMAPTLLGYHRRVTCAACGSAFPVGAAAELGLSQHVEASAAVPPSPTPACRCPNCGLPETDAAAWPVSEGDQILVHKTAFAARRPRRWEVVVFRSPGNPRQAFVKRVAGLPGESVAIDRGDVVVDGRLRRKPSVVQRACRVPVYDDSRRPADADWRPRWLADEGILDLLDTGGGEFRFPVSPRWQWVHYRHWVRSGGTHRTAVDLSGSPDVDVRRLTGGRVQYEPRGRLVTRGAMSTADRDALLASTRSEAFASAVERLADDSHVAPITDTCAYNAGDPPVEYAVRDLMWSGRVVLDGGASFRVRLLYGRQPLELVLDAASRSAVLATVGESGVAVVLARGTMPADAVGGPFELMFSTFDRQCIAEIDGRPLFPAVPFEATPLTHLRSRRPVRFAARGGRVDVSHVRLHRDVYYTPRPGGPTRLGWDELYVLGDNSPVSVDSRRWSEPAVPAAALLGKPFLVHLPSRRTAGPNSLRTPDWGRVRTVR